VVLVAVLLEMEAEVQQRLRDDLLGTENEGDEQSSDPSISIEEGMNGLELRVSKSRLDERRRPHRIVVQEELERSKSGNHLVRRRRDEASVARPGPPDPVLGCPEFTGSSGPPPALP
jgi:hypothetical protein